jgi:hypothetical protein
MPHPFAPVVTVLGAMLLALVCVGWNCACASPDRSATSCQPACPLLMVSRRARIDRDRAGVIGVEDA